MNDVAKHYSLVKEHPDHFEVHDARDNKRFQIAKKPLHPATQLKIMKMKKFNQGGVEEADDSDEGDGSAGQVPASLQANPQDSEPNTAQGESPEVQAAPPPGSGVAMPANYPTSDELRGNVAAENKAIGQEAQAKGAQNQAIANVMPEDKELAKRQQQAFQQQDFIQNRMKTLSDQYDKMFHDAYDAKVDPDRLWNSRLTGQKIAASIGILLSGIGQGISHGQIGTNSAMDLINKHIQNDIEAQKEQLGRRQSLLGENLRQQGDLRAAMNSTLMQYNAMTEGRIAKAAALTGNPIITAQAQQHMAQNRQRMMPLATQLADHEWQMNLKKSVLGRLQAGDPNIDMTDMATAGLVDKGTAEKEQNSINKRQAAEQYIYDTVGKLDKEQQVVGDKFTLNPFNSEGRHLPNIINPTSYNIRDQAKAGIIQAIQAASPSKKLSPEFLSQEVEPFLTKTFESGESRQSGLEGLINLVRSHADETPTASHFKVPGAMNPRSPLRKNFTMGPPK